MAGEDAENDCNNAGGHLASIHSASESSFINSLYSGLPIWIGGTYVDPEVGLQYKYMHIYYKYFMNSRLPQLRTVVISRFCIRLVEYKFFNENSNKPLTTAKGTTVFTFSHLCHKSYVKPNILIRYPYG